MNKSKFVPILIVLALVLVPLAAESSSGASEGIGVVTCSYFDEKSTVSIDDVCNISVGLKNTSATDSVLVTMSQKGDKTIKLVNEIDSYPLTANKDCVITLEFKPDRSAQQTTYNVTVNVSVYNTTTLSSDSRDITFSIYVKSIYSTEEYYNKILGIFDNPLPAPFNTVEFTLAITFCLWIVISAIVTVLIQYAVNFAMKGIDKKGIKIDARVGLPVFVCVFTYGLVNCLRVCGTDPELVSTITFWMNVVYVPIIAFIVWKVYKAIVYRLLNNLEKKTGNEYIYESTSPLLNSIGKIAIVTVGTAAILASLGLNLAVIITGAGIAGIAISLGTKSAFNELFSGLTVLVTRPFKVGDIIKLSENGEEMTVQKVGVLNTELKNRYNVDKFTLPNSMIASSKIINLTRTTVKHRIYVYVSVDVHDDLELAKKLIRESGFEEPEAITDGSFSKPHVRLNDISNGIATFKLAVYLKDVRNEEEIYGRLRESILKKFRENGVEIPFQKVTIIINDERKGVTN